MLESLQNILALALYDPDPKAKLEALARTAELSREERDILSGVQARGLKLTHLLLMNLRFERVLRGCPALKEWFEAEPEGFVAVFRKYHKASPPKALFASQEAEGFLGFLEQCEPESHRRWVAEVADSE